MTRQIRNIVTRFQELHLSKAENTYDSFRSVDQPSLKETLDFFAMDYYYYFPPFPRREELKANHVIPGITKFNRHSFVILITGF